MAVIKCHIKVFIFISVQVFVLLIVLERIYKEAVLGGCPIWVFDLLLTSKARKGKKPTLRMVLLNVRQGVYDFWACQVLIGVCPDHSTNKIQSQLMYSHESRLLTESARILEGRKKCNYYKSSSQKIFSDITSMHRVTSCCLDPSRPTKHYRPFWGNNWTGCWNFRGTCNTAFKQTTHHHQSLFLAKVMKFPSTTLHHLKNLSHCKHSCHGKMASRFDAKKHQNGK